MLGSLILILAVLIWRGTNTGVFGGYLLDPDSYMWLTRVLHLHETKDWFGQILPRVNPPIGYEQHWTRLFDGILYAGAWVGMPFVGFKEALFAWSFIVSPLAALLTVVSLYWGFAPVLSSRQRSPLGVLFISQYSLLTIYQIGRPDNHLLQILLFSLMLGFTVRLLVGPFNVRDCYCAGLVLAAAVWVSIEGMLGLLVVELTLALYWVLGNPGFAKKAIHLSLGLFGFSAFALLVEHGFSGFLDPVYDQLSIVHISLFGLMATFWGIVWLLDRRAWPCKALHRVCIGVVGGLIVGVLMMAIFPAFFSDPYKIVDELFVRVYLPNITELYSPVIALIDGQRRIMWEAGFLWLGILIPGVPALIYLIRHSEKTNSRAWVLIAIGLLILLPLALEQRRVCRYVAILMLPCYSWMVAALTQKAERHLPKSWAIPARVGILVLAVFVLSSPAKILGWPVFPRFYQAQLIKKQEFTLLCNFLNEPEGLGRAPQRVLVGIDLGPELLFRTRHSVFSISSHRYHTGLADIHSFFSADSDKTAREIIERREVDLIIINKNDRGLTYRREGDRSTPLFYRRLYFGNAPDWLEAIDLPAEIAKGFELYRVNLPESAGQKNPVLSAMGGVVATDGGSGLFDVFHGENR